MVDGAGPALAVVEDIGLLVDGDPPVGAALPETLPLAAVLLVVGPAGAPPTAGLPLGAFGSPLALMGRSCSRSPRSAGRERFRTAYRFACFAGCEPTNATFVPFATIPAKSLASQLVSRTQPCEDV